MTTDRCAACHEPFSVEDDRIAARVAGRVAEYHVRCLEDARPPETPRTVGDRMGAILQDGRP